MEHLSTERLSLAKAVATNKLRSESLIRNTIMFLFYLLFNVMF